MASVRNKPGRQGRPRRGRWLLNIALVLAVVTGLHWWQTRSMAEGRAPALRGELVSTEAFDLSKVRDQPILVYFWATWCPICKLEQGTIDALAKDRPVVSVAWQSGDADRLRNYLDEQGLAFPTLPDPYGEHATRWGVHAVPASFVVDANGDVRFVEVGYTTGLGLRARLWAARHFD
jgi:thiol-disulfide isomerase/thioredoxin